MITNKSVNRLLLLTVVIYVAVSIAIRKLTFLELPLYVSLIVSEAMVLLPSIVYFRVKHVAIREVIPFKKMKFSVWVLVVVCTYLMYPLMTVLNSLTLFFVESETASMMAEIQNGNFFIYTLVMACLPAFVEEFVFRGVLFQTYKKSKLLPAVLLSGFLFGCMHMNFNQFLYTFALGLYMALLIEATGSILSSMLAHFTINFTSVAMSYLLDFLNKAMPGTGLDESSMLQESGNFLSSMDKETVIVMAFAVAFIGIISIGTTAGAIGIYIAISKLSGKWNHVKTMFRGGNRERLLTLSLLPAVVIMVGIMIRFR